MKAVGGPARTLDHYKGSVPGRKDGPGQDRRSTNDRAEAHDPDTPVTRNARSVWTIATQPYKEAHFATFPPELPRRCILAGCPVGGTVLDPFAGSGTTLAVALKLGRRAIGVELSPEYAELARERISKVTPSLFFEQGNQ